MAPPAQSRRARTPMWRRAARSLLAFVERLPSGERREIHRLRRLPRRVATHTRLLGREIEVVDGCNYLERRVDFLKIDVEGAETAVLRDCGDGLMNVELAFVEHHSHSSERQDLHDLLQTLHGAGFRYHVKEAYTVPAPFRDRPTQLGMDLQLNVFAFRE